MPGMFNQMGGYSAQGYSAVGPAAFTAAPVSGGTTAPTSMSSIFGPQPTGGSSGSAGSFLGALNPFKAFGLTFWSGVIAVGILIVIRHSLPA